MAKTLRLKLAADTVLVRFKNVGRDNRTWDAVLPANDTQALAHEAKSALMSAGVDCFDGKVYAGMRHVGDYEIIQTGKPTAEKAKPKKATAKKKATKKKAKNE